VVPDTFFVKTNHDTRKSRECKYKRIDFGFGSIANDLNFKG